MKTWIAAMALIGMALGLAPLAKAQDVAPTQIPLNFTMDGEVFSYLYTMQLIVEQQMGERPLETQSSNHRMKLAFTVRQPQQAGNAELTMRIQEATMGLSDGTGDDARRVTLSIPSIEPPDPDDEAQQALINIERLLEVSVITFSVTSTGEVENVKGLEQVVQAIAALDDPDPRLLGQLAPGQIEHLLESIFSADGAAGSSRRVGDGWQNAWSVDVPPVAVLDFTDEVKLEIAIENMATLSAKGSVSVRRPSTADPARPTISVDDYTSTAITQWDVRTGRMDSRKSNMIMTSTWQLEEVELHQKQVLSVKFKRTQ